MVMNDSDEEEEKWVGHYSSFHRILLVGEGDFSFSLSLALSFGSASNIVATSPDSFDVLIKKYREAKSNLGELHRLRASLSYGVDATKMKLHTDLQMEKFDRIIYNFPHAGFHGKEDKAPVIRMHRSLVHGFFRNASGMLRAYGEIHVNHKTTAPFCHWNIEELAYWNSLVLIERVGFRKEDYPGYKNKRGSGSKCDDPFHLGECSTFKFRLSTTARKMTTERRSLDLPSNKLQQVQEIPTYVPQQSSSFELSRPFPNSISCISGCLGSVEFLPNVNISSECSRTFSGYFNHVVGTFGLTDYDVRYYVHEALRLGYERYVAEGPGQSLTGYITILQELQHLSSLRSAWLRRMLLVPDHQL